MIVAALLVMASAWLVDPDLSHVLLGCLLGWTLLALAWIDLATLRLPDALTLPLIVVGLAAAWWDSPSALYAAVVGTLAGYIAFAALAASYRLLRSRDGLGGGDAKLLAAGGAWLGWAALPWVALLAALFGLMFALVNRCRGQQLTSLTLIPFGPSLALAIWIIWLIGMPGV